MALVLTVAQVPKSRWLMTETPDPSAPLEPSTTVAAVPVTLAVEEPLTLAVEALASPTGVLPEAPTAAQRLTTPVLQPGVLPLVVDAVAIGPTTAATKQAATRGCCSAPQSALIETTPRHDGHAQPRPRHYDPRRRCRR